MQACARRGDPVPAALAEACEFADPLRIASDALSGAGIRKLPISGSALFLKSRHARAGGLERKAYRHGVRCDHGLRVAAGGIAPGIRYRGFHPASALRPTRSPGDASLKAFR